MLSNILSLISPVSVLIGALVWLLSTRDITDDNALKIDKIEKEITMMREKAERVNVRLSRMEGKIDLLLSR